MAKLNKFRPFIEQPEDQTIRYIALTRGLFAIVDADEYVYLSQWNWYAARIRKTNIFYAARKGTKAEGGRAVYMHRQLTKSDLPETDHINRNTLDNRKSNLRPCKRGDNQANRGKDKRNTSGYKGVSWSKQNKKWQAQTSVGGKHVHLGFSDKPEDAHKLYCDYVLSIKGKFARF